MFGGLKQQKLILSEFWRPGIQNQNVNGSMISLKFLEENLPYLSLFSDVAGNLGFPCLFLLFQFLPPLFHMGLSGLLIRTPVIGFRVYPN